MPIRKLPEITSDGGGGIKVVNNPKPSKVTVASKKPTSTTNKAKATIVPDIVESKSTKRLEVVEDIIPEKIIVDRKETVITSKTTKSTSEPTSPKITKIGPKNKSVIDMRVIIPKLEDDRGIRLAKISDEPVKITEANQGKTSTFIDDGKLNKNEKLEVREVFKNNRGFLFMDANGNLAGLPNTSVKIIKEEEPPVIEKILTPVDDNIDKDPVTNMTIDPKYFMPTNIIDRKSTATVFNFDYLSYLFFQVNINEKLPSFYNAVDYIIENKLFARDEDFGVVAPENDIDYETMALIFRQVWDLAVKAADEVPEAISIKNVIGFYIYFNRRLGFLPILIQGTTLNDFFSDMTLNSILDKLTSLGLYPVSGYNLFERLWNSYTYSVTENANRAEIKLSLKEFISYDINRNMAETYDGFVNKNDQLIITYKLDPTKWAEKKTFKSESSAFKRFKKINTDYITAQEAITLKRYLLELLPVQDYTGTDVDLKSSIYVRKSIMSSSTNTVSPNRNLWLTLQSFDVVFKINRLEVNKAKIRDLFIEFSSSQGFPIGTIGSNEYLNLWLSWVEYLNNRASSISTALINFDDINHNYKDIYNQLVWLTNAKFIIQYLQNNNSFKESAYADGANYINAAILKVYQSLSELKTQLKNVITYIKKEDKRFYSSHIK